MHRLYENDDLAVFWNSDKCYKAKQCVTNSTKVFEKTIRSQMRL